MTLLEFAILAPVSIFVIINPLSIAPAYLAMTPGESLSERIATARRACLLAGLIAAFFAVSGQFVLSFLGITLPALQIAGGVILFLIALDMVRAPDPQVRLTTEEKILARDKEDVSVTPLAVPLLCGPGAISTVLILQTQALDFRYNAALLLAVAAVYIGCFATLALAASGGRWLNPIVLRVTRRLMGLLFATVACQFMINGIGNLPFMGNGS